ncbi:MULTISPECIES: type IV pilus biogenesis/stability protein PilW [unclassified Pseudoalteromonas]|uniref:type IV pilus biogenesis/stability protein PilW n=1 Tax=unclassified Pseudoalteromonas TaxID=194690 RepID=UPI00110887A9|nr:MULTISPECIES: type IV pilus biogenesis/stability protein PilW [unclassified Pseudoalteromonas]TMN83520.1 type IV pilus biogenesis/stability protein PilW [Pseudoalteromonas sp. S410]TMN90959.1 type IV pilus biogenesis/stability protein PilW [Pseudoalteromonas sp. S408]TMN94573.1 type IV pilus biogenesis/stability protein PilW [Pseudoalteromonas sp. S407]TMN99042.1 type IV pilus biogenesis/stability protein PilW [Pseudoalteromonas sp. S409]TMO10002.1 type IV pilus biogenesis/stability protein
MRSILAITLSALALSGCVTESSYNGSNKPVVKNKINNAGAARTRIALALQYLKTGNNSQAKYNLERAAEFAPNLPEVHYSMAYYYQQVGENPLADRAYQKALDIKPDDPNTLNNYGVFLCGIDEYDRATDQFLKAIEIPTYIRVAESYENLALCAIEFDDFENAETYFKQALNHSSQRTSTLISLAALFYAKSDLYKANDILKKHDDTGRVSSRALMLSYLVKNRMGRIEEAEKVASTLLQTYSTSNEAYAIREQRTRFNEFEMLREKYRKAKLNELKADADSTYISAKPKIKIVRKKAPTQDDTKSLIIKQPAQVRSVEPEQNTQDANPVIARNDSSISAENTVAEVSATPKMASKKATTKTAVTAIAEQPEQAEIKQVTPTGPSTDTSAVLLALTTEPKAPNRPETVIEKPATKPSTAPATVAAKVASAPPKEEVKIISFGAPKTANFNSPQTNQPAVTANTTVANNESNVVFYEATKNEDIFETSDYQSGNDVTFTNLASNKQTALPMLNPKVAALRVPFHIIEFGENLFSISVRYNVKLQKLLQWNGLKESDRVMNGSKIYLNDPNIYYEIKSGDSLYDIATQKQVLIDELMRWNKLSPDIELKPGHRLLLVDPDSYLL